MSDVTNELLRMKLRRSVTFHDEEISELVLREPTGADMRALDLPYQIGDGAVKISGPVAMQWIERLSSLPRSKVEQIHVLDLQQLQMKVASFFLEGMGSDLAAATT